MAAKRPEVNLGVAPSETQRVLVDRMEDLVLIARTEGQAPEIDGVVYLSEVDAAPGEFVDVTITDAREYNLMGEGERKVTRLG